MKIRLYGLWLAALAMWAARPADAQTVTQYVNPLLGTTTLWTPEDLGYTRTEVKRAWGAEAFPGAALPNAMVQCTPVTMYKSGSGYQYEDHQIYGFAHSAKGHWDQLHLPMLPVTGRFYPYNYCSYFSHEQEEAHPGYYSVFLQRYQVKAELTTTLRCAYHRYTFRKQDEKRMLVDITKNNGGARRWQVQKSSAQNAFEGYQDGHGRMYFYAVADRKVTGVQLLTEKKSTIAVVDFDNNKGEDPLNVKIGFSFVSIDNARQNLEAEMLDKTFEQVREEADQTWNNLLGHIQVEGGTPEQTRMLYSTLYKTFLWPVLRSDVNGEYLDNRHQVVKGDFRYYTDPSFWDTYRNKLVMLAILSPDVTCDIIKSCIDRGEKRGGYMPTFFHGDHASTWISGTWQRGIHGFDLERAYKLILKNATVPGRGGRPYLDEYIRQGWIAEKDTTDVPTEDEYKAAVTKTQEYAYDDYAVAQVANILKDKANYKLLMERSRNYKNLFDPSTGFWRGRIASGEWIRDFDPYYPYYAYMYREANAWQSLFFAPHDPEGMLALYPSHQAVEQKLDSLFTEPWRGYEAWNMTGFMGNYCHGNQPDHSVPYTYYFIGKQVKAQAILNTLMRDYYGMGAEKLAYAGMDDAGEMSTWYVFNAIGLYPYSPADPRYIVTVPLFPQVRFTMADGRSLTIRRTGEGAEIKKILLGGKPVKGWFVDHNQMLKAGALEVVTE
ncbi:MAG: glycoside hydrolase family 92 protein [Bacteroidaceae bacterium]|nr:glycoside hydrolase family 92 protein [Bacteroidaceae bacterium]